MPSARTRLLPLALAALSALAAGCDDGGSAGPPGGVRFRTQGDGFEIGDAAGQGWRPFFPKGVNLAIAKPGRFPGELAATRADYDRWLRQIADLNSNVVRLYTLHPPHFYEALGAYNAENPGRPIYLIQGIWLDELTEGDYITDSSAQIAEDIVLTVDAVHGNASIPFRRGKAWGEYRHDLSSHVLAWLPGSEMDGFIVENANGADAALVQELCVASDPDDPATFVCQHPGRFVSLAAGQPIQAWVARELDRLVAHELDRYGVQRPVGWSSWPALDPITHPTEPRERGQDVVNVDLGAFTTGGGFDSGIFVSYHVYPYDPEFLCYDPVYTAPLDESGRRNPYLRYLVDLKSRHQGIPLIVTEYGLPSSFGVARWNDAAWSHGGYSEAEQAEHVPALLASIVDAGAAGAVVFELLDEWFKQTWVTRSTTIPADRAPLWYDVLSPEQSYGLVAHYPVSSSITVDGAVDDWATRGEHLVEQAAAPLAPRGDALDGARTLRALHAAADPAFLFLRLDLDAATAAALEDVVLLVGISTLGGATGGSRFPEQLPVSVGPDAGLEAMVVLDLAGGIAELRIDHVYDPAPRLNFGTLAGGTPLPNADGEFVLSSLVVNSNAAYVRDNLPPPPLRWYDPGLLRRGTSTEDTVSHFQLGPGVVELRLPWHALWVTDPSSHHVLHDDPETYGLDARPTAGFQLFVATATRATPDGPLELVDVLPRAAYSGGAFDAAAVPVFLWPGWDEVPAEERLKPVYHAIREAHALLP